MLSWSLLSHLAVAPAWGAQTQCQCLDFPEVGASFGRLAVTEQLHAHGTAQTVCDAQPCAICRIRHCVRGCCCGTQLHMLMWWAHDWHWRDKCVSDMLVFTEVQSWVIALLLRRASASWKVLIHGAEGMNIYRRAWFSENSKYPEITFSSF